MSCFLGIAVLLDLNLTFYLTCLSMYFFILRQPRRYPETNPSSDDGRESIRNSAN